MKYLKFKPPKKAVFVSRNRSLGIIFKKKGEQYCRERELTQEKDGDLIKPEPEESYLRAEGIELNWRQSKFVEF